MFPRRTHARRKHDLGLLRFERNAGSCSSASSTSLSGASEAIDAGIRNAEVAAWMSSLPDVPATEAAKLDDIIDRALDSELGVVQHVTPHPWRSRVASLMLGLKSGVVSVWRSCVERLDQLSFPSIPWDSVPQPAVLSRYLGDRER